MSDQVKDQLLLFIIGLSGGLVGCVIIFNKFAPTVSLAEKKIRKFVYIIGVGLVGIVTGVIFFKFYKIL